MVWMVAWISCTTMQATQQSICICSQALERRVDCTLLSPHSPFYQFLSNYQFLRRMGDSGRKRERLPQSNVWMSTYLNIVHPHTEKRAKYTRDEANGLRRELHHVGGTAEQQTVKQASYLRTATKDIVLTSHWRPGTHLPPTKALTKTGYCRSWLIPMSIRFEGKGVIRSAQIESELNGMCHLLFHSPSHLMAFAILLSWPACTG